MWLTFTTAVTIDLNWPNCPLFSMKPMTNFKYNTTPVRIWMNIIATLVERILSVAKIKILPHHQRQSNFSKQKDKTKTVEVNCWRFHFIFIVEHRSADDCFTFHFNEINMNHTTGNDYLKENMCKICYSQFINQNIALFDNFRFSRVYKQFISF